MCFLCRKKKTPNKQLFFGCFRKIGARGWLVAVVCSEQIKFQVTSEIVDVCNKINDNFRTPEGTAHPWPTLLLHSNMLMTNLRKSNKTKGTYETTTSLRRENDSSEAEQSFSRKWAICFTYFISEPADRCWRAVWRSERRSSVFPIFSHGPLLRARWEIL